MRKQINNYTKVFLLGVIVLLLSGCNATKYLKDDQTFYGGAEIKFSPQGNVGSRTEIKRNLELLVRPEPNTKVLGMRPGVWLYFRQRDDARQKGLKAFIRRKFGQTPVLMSDVNPQQVVDLFERQLQNDGYFGSEVEYAIREKKKESVVVYNVLIEPPYRLRNIVYPTPKDSVYARILKTLHENSILKENQRYELSRLQAEQARIETEVKNYGLYYFDDRYLIFEADSTVGKKEIDLRLRLEKGIPENARKIFRFGEVNIFPDFTLNADSARLRSNLVELDGHNYYDYSGKFRPQVISRVVNMHKGDIYTRDAHELTLSHLMDLGVFKFVNVQFSEMGEDTTLLRSDVYLTPLKRKSIRAEFQGVSKSNNFVGPGFQLTFMNRNALRGAELFQVRFNTSYEVQFGQRISGPLNSFEMGLQSSLTIPRFIAPIPIDYSTKKFLPKTNIGFNVTLQNRVGFFRMNSFNINYGYLWRESQAKSHEFYPIDINFVRTDRISPEFDEILGRNTFLKRSFDDQFILGARYVYTLNTQLKEELTSAFQEKRFKTHSFFFTANLQVAGNALQGVQRATSRKTEEGNYQIFNLPYSQFARADLDLRHYWQLDQRNKLASRLNVGVGYAYGNSQQLPYIRQFAVGGSNSVRAFPARSLGPGAFFIGNAVQPAPGDSNNGEEDPVEPTEEESTLVPVFVDQRGDIKLEGNVELRFDIIKAFKGAVFVDAGNIWLWEGDIENRFPGGQFDHRTFIKELAVGTGLGFRLDLSFFVLRLDIAFPIRKPWLPEEERWVIRDIAFGSSAWRRDNLLFNIAIGYPF